MVTAHWILERNIVERRVISTAGFIKVFPPRWFVSETLHSFDATLKEAFFNGNMATDGAYKLELEPQKQNVFVTQLR